VKSTKTKPGNKELNQKNIKMYPLPVLMISKISKYHSNKQTLFRYGEIHFRADRN